MKATAETRDWTIVTVTEGGTVSILKQLTRQEALGTLRLVHPPLEGNPWPRSIQHDAMRKVRQEAGDTYPFSSCWGGHSVSKGDIKSVDSFGPGGEALQQDEIWPKPADFDERVAREMIVQRKIYEAQKSQKVDVQYTRSGAAIITERQPKGFWQSIFG